MYSHEDMANAVAIREVNEADIVETMVNEVLAPLPNLEPQRYFRPKRSRSL